MIKAQLAYTAETLNYVQHYIESERHVAEEKINGQRIILRVKDDKVSGFSRQGDEMNIPKSFVFNFNGFNNKEWLFDGEYVDGHYYMFDILRAGPTDYTVKPYAERRAFLERFFELQTIMAASMHQPHTSLVPVARTTAEKQELYDRTKANNQEGLVFKPVDLIYRPGDSNYWVKCKHFNTVDCFITEMQRGGKPQAVTLGLYDADGKEFEVSGLKVPLYALDRVDVGTVVEVKYLHATKDDQLNIPTFERIRLDKTPETCYTSQLKYENQQP